MGGGWNNGQWEPHWFTPKPVVISTTPWRTLDHEYCAANRYRLLPQNDNPFDENALKVMCTRTNEEEFQVGWCPMSDTKLVRFLINVWEYSLDLVVLQPGKERARLVVQKVPPPSPLFLIK